MSTAEEELNLSVFLKEHGLELEDYNQIVDTIDFNLLEDYCIQINGSN